MPVGNQSPVSSELEKADHEVTALETSGPRNYSRRDALRAMGKYSAAIGSTGVVVLSAQDAVAMQACSVCVSTCATALLGNGFTGSQSAAEALCVSNQQIGQPLSGIPGTPVTGCKNICKP